MSGARNAERGGALILALLMAAAFALIGAGLLASSLNSTRVASNEDASVRAFGLADAGIERARVALVGTTVNTLLAGGGNLFTNQALNSGSYSVVVTNNLSTRFPLGTIPADAGGASNDTDGYLVVNSTGTFGAAQRKIEVIVRKTTGNGYAYAVWSNSGATFGGAGYTDSYDSSAGPYTSPGGNSANAFSNGNMTMQASSMIHGSATVGGTIDSTHVYGGAANTTTGAPTQSMSASACPAMAYTPAANITGSGITYNEATGVFKVQGGGVATITAPPNTLYFSAVTVSASTLIINTGGTHVDLYCSGTMTISGTGLVNSSAKARELTLNACGAGTNNWTVSGGSQAAFVIYAPTRDITISGTSPIFGAVYGDNVTDSGGSMIHYDTSLAATPGVTAVAHSWAEIYQ